MATTHPCPECGAPCYGKVCIKCRNGDGKPNAVDEQFEREDSGDIATLKSVSDRITTADQLCEFAKIDRSVWEIARQTVSKWESPNRDGTRQLFQVRVQLRRKVPERVELAIEAIIARMDGHQPKYNKVSYKPLTKNPCMLEFSPFDMHFGKLAWRNETGEDYDLEIAERSLAGAVTDLMFTAKHYTIEKFLFPVGSDWFHVDNMLGETVKGTPQDTDGRWAKMFEVGEQACVRAIDRMREAAPVTVAWISGNHDWTTSWYLVKCLAAHYRNVDEVRVICDPVPRRYIWYGTTLLGFTHGNEEKHSSLPALMATEKPTEWAATTHHEWHVGQFHRRRQIVHTAVDTHDGVTVRVLPSLSGRDAWHAKKGYLSQRVAEAYLWSKALGYQGHFAVGKQQGVV
jgi:hypothetical protein